MSSEIKVSKKKKKRKPGCEWGWCKNFFEKGTAFSLSELKKIHTWWIFSSFLIQSDHTQKPSSCDLKSGEEKNFFITKTAHWDLRDNAIESKKEREEEGRRNWNKNMSYKWNKTLNRKNDIAYKNYFFSKDSFCS